MMADYCEALLQEFDHRRREIAEPFDTVYIGGGTPSSLPMESLAGLIRGIGERLGGFGSVREFTVEVNPDDVTAELLDNLRLLGVNRISMGIQSFCDAELVTVNRRHDSATARQALKLLKDSGMNYSADLIFGLPGQDLASWERSLDELLAAQPPHLSAYLLSFEPGTRLYARLQAGKVEEASEALVKEMYALLTAKTRAAGYEHYEISNYALRCDNADSTDVYADVKSCRSIHNSNYWKDIPYLGLGVTAHSFDGQSRRSNPPRIADYIEAMASGIQFCEVEEEDRTDRANDRILVSLRTSDGLDLKRFERDFGLEYAKKLCENAASMLRSGLLINLPDGSWRVPESEWLLADSVIRDLMLE